jgi:hypothetical protein
MSRIKSQRLYALTNRDVDRITALLQSVEEAVVQLIEHRCLRPLEPGEGFPLEDSVYRQTSQILRDCGEQTPDECF